MAILLQGNWRKGIAFDVHTVDSVYIGVDQAGRDRWDTRRSEMGELVYQLKYQRNRAALPKIVNLLDRINGIEKFDLIAPIPPSDASRGYQPVTEIALAIGQRRGVKVLHDLLRKGEGGRQLKNVEDPNQRYELLRQSMYLSGGYDLSGAKILLVDDLYRSGATLAVATDLLLTRGRAGEVCVLTMTKTRSKR
jgi:competence protein ComFC